MEEKENDKKTNAIYEAQIQQILNKLDVKNVKKWKKIMHLIFLIVSVIVGIKYCEKISCFDEFLYNEFALYIIALLITFFELEIVYIALKFCKNRKINIIELFIFVFLIFIVIGIIYIPVGEKIEVYTFNKSGMWMNEHDGRREIHKIYNVYYDFIEMNVTGDEYPTTQSHLDLSSFASVSEIDNIIEEENQRLLRKISVFAIILGIYNLYELCTKKKIFNYIILMLALVCIAIILLEPAKSYFYYSYSYNWYNKIVETENYSFMRELERNSSIYNVMIIIWIIFIINLIKLMFAKKFNKKKFALLLAIMIFVLYIFNDIPIGREKNYKFYTNIYDIVLDSENNTEKYER